MLFSPKTRLALALSGDYLQRGALVCGDLFQLYWFERLHFIAASIGDAR